MAEQSSTKGIKAVVKWYNPTKGFGFVDAGDGRPDAFLHVSSVEQTEHGILPEGTEIECDIGDGPRGLQVTEIYAVHLPQAADAPDDSANWVSGIVKFYNPIKGYGFISPATGERDVFISVRVLERYGFPGLHPGQAIDMVVSDGKAGPMADAVRQPKS